MKNKNLKFFVLFHNNILDFCKNISKENNCTFILPQNFSYKTEENSLKFKRIDTFNLSILKFNFMLYSPKEIWKNIEKKDEFIIIKHLFQPSSILLLLICKLKRKNTIIYTQKIPEYKFKFFLKIIIKILTSKNTKAFTTNKPDLNNLKYYIKNSKYIPLGINSEVFKKRVNKNKNKQINIICVGILNQERKNQHFLIKQLEKIQKKYEKHNIKIKLTLVGNLSDSFDNTYYNNLKTLSKKVSYKIIFKKNLKYKNMLEEYSKHDLFILPAYSEPVGYSILEAMSSKLPIICSNECGAKDYINTVKENGYIFQLKKKDDLMKKIENLIINKKNSQINWNKINKLGENSIQIVKKEHNPQILAETFKNNFIK